MKRITRSHSAPPVRWARATSRRLPCTIPCEYPANVPRNRVRHRVATLASPWQGGEAELPCQGQDLGSVSTVTGFWVRRSGVYVVVAILTESTFGGKSTTRPLFMKATLAAVRR